MDNNFTMNSCNHIGWFYLSGRDNYHIHYGRRTASVVDEMTDPTKQYPAMIFFLGSKAKDEALREIFPHNNIRRGRHDGIVNLRLDSSTISAELPLLFSDSNPLALVPHRLGAVACHETRKLPLVWGSQQPRNILYTVYARLVAVFSDVICIFADDVGGLESVAYLLRQWIEMGTPSTIADPVRPRVIIVVREDTLATTENVIAIEHLRHELQENIEGTSRTDCFSSISILHLANDHVSSLARHRRLKECLLSEIEHQRRQRIEFRLHFTAIHLESFVRRAVEQVANSVTEPFNFVKQSRFANEVQDSYQDHLITFTKLAKDYFLSYRSLVSFIASSILMDAYPPRMHSKR